MDGSPFFTLAEAKKARGRVNEGANGQWKVDKAAPGDYKTRIQWQCNHHVACPVRLQACVVAGGFGFRVRGEHSSTENSKRRLNSALTFSQEASVAEGIKSGGKPAGLMAAMTLKELDAAKAAKTTAAKRPEGGLEGEQSRNVVGRLVFRCGIPSVPSVISHMVLPDSPCRGISRVILTGIPVVFSLPFLFSLLFR